MKLWETRPMPGQERRALTYIAMALWVGVLVYNVSHVQEHLGQNGIHDWRMWCLSMGPDILIGVGIWKLRYRALDGVAWLMAASGTAWLAWAALSTCAPTMSGRLLAAAPIAVVGMVTASIEFGHRVESTVQSTVESTVESSAVEPVESSQSTAPVAVPVEAAVDPVESVDPAAVESGAGAPVDHAPAARVAQLHAVPDASAQSIKGDADPAVVQAIKEAVEAGEITWPVKYEPARQHLKIGVPKIKAAVKELQEQGWSPVQDDEQAVGE